jgi:DNA-binding NarL/FixJ family response regulator
MPSRRRAIPVTIVDADPATRREGVNALKRWPEYRVAAEYGSGEEALEKIPLDPPTFVLMDIALSGISGIECTRALKRVLPAVHILMLTASGDWEDIFEAFRAGATGYLLKDLSAADLKAALEEVGSGGVPAAPPIARQVLTHFRNACRKSEEPARNGEVVDWVLDCLSPRENDVLKWLSEGCDYVKIARRMGISLNTVRTYIRRIYDKLQVQSRTAAVLKYLAAKEK